MAGIEAKSFDAPDEVRTPPLTKIDIVNMGGTEIGRFTLQPGWKWSECIKPLVKTDKCQAEHLGVVISGQMHVVHDDGSTADPSAGEVYLIAPGHDAWITSDEAFVAIEFKSAATYAKG